MSAPVSTEGFDPARLKARIEEIDPKMLEPIVKKAADNFYCTVMETAEDYLRENLDWNISSHISMLERENQRMRTELYEVDRALGGNPLGHENRISSIRDLQSRHSEAVNELWKLRRETEQPL